MTRMIHSLLVLCALVCMQAYAWHDMGHVLVAEIARRTIPAQLIEKVDALGNVNDPYFQGGITRLPYSAVWMDYIKDDTNVFDTQHYLDIPIEKDGVVAPTPDRTNIATSLEHISNTLMFKGDTSRAWGKGLSMMMLIHFMGDLHQPLHASSLYSSRFPAPDGDAGGNFFKIHYTNEQGETYDQLHKFFDACGGQYVGRLKNPVDSEAEFAVNMRKHADELMKEFPETTLTDTCPAMDTTAKFQAVIQRWLTESNDKAKWAYDQVEYDQPLTVEFVAAARKMLRERIALAGYRLGCILQHVDYSMRGSLPPSSSGKSYETDLYVVSAILCIVVLIVVFVAAGGWRAVRKGMRRCWRSDEPDLIGYEAEYGAVGSQSHFPSQR